MTKSTTASSLELSTLVAPGTQIEILDETLDDRVTLRLYRFIPALNSDRPLVLFVAGWISRIQGWADVLREMTRDFPVLYIETREKVSSRVKGRSDFGVEAIGRDLSALVQRFTREDEPYLLLGSSLGATAILDAFSRLPRPPLMLALVAPNAVFRVPWAWKLFLRPFYPGLYLAIKPVVKWYLRTFRMDVSSDRAQYDKYCGALDAADPWKLKNAVVQLWNYQVWDKLPAIDVPVLLFSASKDTLHEPENLKRMADILPRATLLDMVTNTRTHSSDMVKELRLFLDSHV